MLTLQTAVEKACASELTEKEASGFQGSSHDVKKVEGTFPECFSSGKTNHSQENVFTGNHSVMNARSLATS